MEKKKYFIDNKEEFLKLQASWKDFVNSKKTIGPEHIIIYNVIRSKSPFNGFTKIKNPGRINARQYGEWDGYLQPFTLIKRALAYPSSYGQKILSLFEPFGITDKDECIELLKRIYEEIEKVPLPE